MCGIAWIMRLNERPVAVDELRRRCAAMVHHGHVCSTVTENPVVREA